MSPAHKLIAGTVLGAGAIAGWSYVKNLKRAAAELEAVPSAAIHKLSWDGLSIRIDVLLKNPTKGSFSVKFPFVKLLYKEAVIGTSQSVDKQIRLPPHGEARIDGILVQVPMTNVFSVAFSLIKALFNSEAAQLTVRTITTIDLGWIVLPYETKTEATIKK